MARGDRHIMWQQHPAIVCVVVALVAVTVVVVDTWVELEWHSRYASQLLTIVSINIIYNWHIYGFVVCLADQIKHNITQIALR